MRPWQNREIIPKLDFASLGVLLQRQLAICQVEMDELKKCQINGAFSNVKIF